MTALAQRTVEVTPLGLRGRYSLTPFLQKLYLAAVAISDRGERVTLYSLRKEMDMSGGGTIAPALADLEERRWIKVRRLKDCPNQPYEVAFVEPVLRDLKPCR